MKKPFTLISLFAAAMFCACSPKPVAVPTLDGVVIEATMNNIFVKTSAGDSLWLSTMDTDPAKVPGVLVADSISVSYKDTMNMKVVTELKVLRPSPYFYIQGQWVEPNPIDAAKVQGFAIKADGTAESINMATLLYKNWNFDLQNLMLSGQSVGNKQTIDFCDTLSVVKLNADSLVLSSKGAVVHRLARQK
ncbi:MAG: lipocalin family protein [Mucinivorans sp.]